MKTLLLLLLVVVRVSPSDEIAKVLFCSPDVSKFEQQFRYYIHFRTNTVGKGMNHFNPSPSYRFSSFIDVLLHVGFGIE